MGCESHHRQGNLYNRAIIAVAFLLIPLIAELLPARAMYDREPGNELIVADRVASGAPFISVAVHNVGKISMTVTNQGFFGSGFVDVTEGPDGEPLPSCEYPIHSNIEYLFSGSFWIGAVVGRDTLVSVGADGWRFTKEMWPASLEEQQLHDEELKIRSISDPEGEDFDLARSEQDIRVVYFDTLTDGISPDPFDNRPHIPLNIKVEQTSYAWSYSYAEDFILFDYAITNIGRNTLNNVYMGIYVDGDVGHPDEQRPSADDICGFKLDVDQLSFRNTSCVFTDTIRIAWISDNDGYNEITGSPPDPKRDVATSPTGLTGTRVVRTPSDSLEFSFNWWVSNVNAELDFGPRLQGTEEDPFRDFGGFLGTPEGDKTKYYVMRHQEFDYDQLFSAVDQTANGWLPPAQQARDIADGFDTRYLLSFGPFRIFPGETLPITFAYVAGENFFTTEGGMNDVFNALQPGQYYNTLDFTDIGINAQWASWIYDNPGVDTDGDGNYGKFRLCCDSSVLETLWDTIYTPDSLIDTILMGDIFFADCDTLYYEGDGAPDFRGASPPPAPTLRVSPSPGELVIRWNGLRSETTPDAFSSVKDFEGYRVYLGLNKRSTDLIMQASYDKENFTRYAWDETTDRWFIAGPPQTLAEIQFLYARGNSDYDPLINGLDNPIRVGDSLFYFTAQDWNQDDLTDEFGIHKPLRYRYNFYSDGSPMLADNGIDTVPTPFPHTLNLDSAFTSDTFLVNPNSGDTTWYLGGELTGDGKFFKYFEYEYRITDLLPSQLYYVSVTSFDFGAPESGLAALESNPLINSVAEYPQQNTTAIEQNDLKVVVYPNPYRIDGRYRELGYEGRDRNDLPDERVRAIHFTNLPAVCTISVFTLDGDLVRQIEHNTAPNSPQSMHDVWDVVTRNTQPAATGIYYWVVEEPDGTTQSGKLVLIM